MGKSLPYKTKKWEKTKDHLIEKHTKYPASERFAEAEKLYSDGKLGKARFHNVLAGRYGIVAQEEFALRHFSECKGLLEKSLNEFLMAIKSAQGNPDDSYVWENIKIDLKSATYGYYAIILDRYNDISAVISPDTSLYKLIVEKEVIAATESKEFIDDMISAISVKDSEKFEEALKNRIKEVRTNGVDFGVCADFRSMALIKEAMKAGLTFYKDYIEVDFEMKETI